MEKVSWETVFSKKLKIILNDKDQVEVFPCGISSLCVFVMQAIRQLRNEFLSGAEVIKNWEIVSFSPEERILKVQKKIV